MNQLTETKPNFKKEWAENDFDKVQAAIKKHFGTKNGVMVSDSSNNRLPYTKYFKNYDSIDNYFGLAYTSSSSYAMYGVCNGVVIYSKEDLKFHYRLFAISEDGKVYAELWDKNENEKFIQL